MTDYSFAGFPAGTLDFFRQLEANNNREWFQANKHLYEEVVRRPMISLVEAINGFLATTAPHYATEPAKSIFRIYRDTRFSKDKTPYKTHSGALFIHQSLAKLASAGLYVSVSHKEVEVAGGIYMPGNEQLLLIRNSLVERHLEFETIAGSLKRLMGELQGEQLARSPKGFSPDHPAADLLRRKQLYWYVTRKPEMALSKKLYGEVTRRFTAMIPALDFLNQPLLDHEKKARRQAELQRTRW